MKIISTDPRIINTLEIRDMQSGQVGYDRDGNLYLRTLETAVCLNNIGLTYQEAKSVKVKVTLVPVGTRILFEVDV